MADISKISINGEAFDVKDATSRSKLATVETALGDLSLFTPEAGRTLAGDLENVMTALGDISDYTGNRETISEELIRIPPEVTAADNGKVLKVVNGVWAKGTDNVGSGSSGLPAVTASDSGKILKVNASGQWAVGTDETGSGSGSGSGTAGTPVVNVNATNGSALHLNKDMVSYCIPAGDNLITIMLNFDDGPGVYHLLLDCRPTPYGVSLSAASGYTYVGTFPTTGADDFAEMSFLVTGAEGNYQILVTGCNWEVGA